MDSASIREIKRPLLNLLRKENILNKSEIISLLESGDINDQVHITNRKISMLGFCMNIEYYIKHPTGGIIINEEILQTAKDVTKNLILYPVNNSLIGYKEILHANLEYVLGASKYGVCKHIDLIELLLENGADPNISCVGTGNHVARLTAYDNCMSIVKLLLKYGADPDFNYNDTHHYSTALWHVMKRGIKEEIELICIFDRIQLVSGQK